MISTRGYITELFLENVSSLEDNEFIMLYARALMSGCHRVTAELVFIKYLNELDFKGLFLFQVFELNLRV